jgi:hypothetical protein
VRGAFGRIAEIYGGGIAAEWARFQVEPPFPSPCDQAFDVEMYCDRWAAQEEPYPMLSLATRTIAKMHPTEAACDRNRRATADTREKATEETEYRGESRGIVENLFKRQARDNTNFLSYCRRIYTTEVGRMAIKTLSGVAGGSW